MPELPPFYASTLSSLPRPYQILSFHCRYLVKSRHRIVAAAENPTAHSTLQTVLEKATSKYRQYIDQALYCTLSVEADGVRAGGHITEVRVLCISLH